ncbi:heavy-metal-associated domain-containing protein [Cellulomonas triticagri]|uniref:Copper chaperone n=1 Tax=Cellulomonas triticagri TaxID=2483352 RepID=A0A3M2J1F5_9CELL|nr:heavy-metal-associated domain-containing protein [Cellulomonas triticagri]RMI06634.1 copper chaperone [Cellulomonas triticagri]
MSQTTTFSVDGMTCGNCVRHVTEELTAIPGVTDVQVDLVAGGSSPVTVTSDGPIADEAVAAAVDEAGYAVTPKGSLL